MCDSRLFQLLALVVLFALSFLGRTSKAFATTIMASPIPQNTPSKSKVSKKKAQDQDEDDEDDDDVDVESDEDLADQGKAISGNAAFLSDYMLRGISQTDHNPALQGGFDWVHPLGMYLGVWGSNVHFSDAPASLELDLYGGYTYHFDEQENEKTSLSAGALYYTYWASSDLNNWMFPVKGQWRAFSLEADYFPHWNGQETQAVYLQAGWQDKLVWDVKLGALAGYSVFVGGEEPTDPNYADFTVSASKEYFGVEWGIAGVFVTETVMTETGTTGNRAVFSMSKGL